jgi:GntR family transcriptional regulator, transcriptional repressor for pyruvate dehydrogenase complex
VGEPEPGAKPAPRIIGEKVLRPRAQVEEKIRETIFTGQVKGGEKLPAEGELARQFGVSRTTVREALRALTAEGLIVKTPGIKGGSFVQSVDYQSLGIIVQDSVNKQLRVGALQANEVAMVRQYLEVPAARLAAAHRDNQHLKTLTETVRRQKSISVESPEVPELDAKFHATIAAASGNRLLSAFVYAMHRETEPVHYLELSPEVGLETVRQHQKILKAINAQDPDAAEKAMIEHLSYLRAHLLPAESGSLDGSAKSRGGGGNRSIA